MTQGPDIPGEIEPTGTIFTPRSPWVQRGQYIGLGIKVAAYFFLIHMLWQNRIEINHIHMTHHGHAPEEATSE